MVLVDKFYGGLSDTDVLMAAGQFPYAEQMEVRRYPDYMEISRKPDKIFETGGDLMLCAVDGYYAGEGGKVYNDAGTLKWTHPGGKDYISATYFQDNYMLAREVTGVTSSIDRILTTAASGAWAGNLVTFSTTAAAYNRCHTFNNYQDDFLYYVADNEIKRCYTDGSPTYNYLPIPSNDTALGPLEDRIVSITRHGPLFRVYLENGKIYLWDGYAENAEAVVEMKDQVRYVYTVGDLDYVVAGDNEFRSRLYMAQGQQFQLMKKSIKSFGTGAQKFWFNIENKAGNNLMASYNNMVYLTEEPSDYNIMSFGKEYDGFQNAFNIDLSRNADGNPIERIGLLHVISGRLYYSWEDNAGLCGIDCLNLAQNVTGAPNNSFGIWYSARINFGDSTQKKRIHEIDLRIDQDTTNNTIELAYALNGSDTYTTFITLVNHIDYTEDGYRYRIPGELIKDEFYEIQFKMTANSTNGTDNVKIYSFNVKPQLVDA